MARIETEQQLREIYKEPAGRAVIKQTDRLEVHSKQFPVMQKEKKKYTQEGVHNTCMEC